MAAPMIAGLVADLLQVHPGWTPDQVKGDLISNAVSEQRLTPGAERGQGGAQLESGRWPTRG